MSEQPNYKLVIDDDDAMTMSLDNGVFVPTGTTTSLIKAVRAYIRQPGKMLDIGSGSGAVGLSLFQNGMIEEPVYASDISEKAVECVKRNAALHKLLVVARQGSLFDPWKDETFDYIINDVSGVAEEVATISPWFNNVPCQSGEDGTALVTEIIRKAPRHLKSGGLLFFPIISFSNVDKILSVAHETFAHVEQLDHTEWPLLEEMRQYTPMFKKMKEKGDIDFIEKFGMLLWYTDIYVAYN